MKFGLRNIRSLLKFVGNPHRKYKTIHIAGTNGKGSTSSMIAAILTAAGYKVGLYTSPHLVKFNERIRINGRMISNTDVVHYTKKLQPQIHKLKATFFEATTAMAFRYFADQKVDVAVIETGLGGRLDSTNVIRPIVSVITSIGKEHTEQLGKTITAIAKEKAGIIKHTTPVVLGHIPRTARTVMLHKAKEMHAPVLFSDRISLPKNVLLQLRGKHQIKNAQCAVAACTIVGNQLLIGDKAIHDGLQHTSALTGLRARFELVKSTPSILLDVAHNPDGLKTLCKELRGLRYKKMVIVFAVMKDKDYLAMGRELRKLHAAVVVTQPNVERALPAQDLYEAYSKLNLLLHYAPSVRDAMRAGRKLAGKRGLVVVTGSHFLVGEVMSVLKI
ncbi:MAG: folylpolyglutamate synthase/dihydrofolate synthase family protein [Bacteroidota bacterium]